MKQNKQTRRKRIWRRLWYLKSMLEWPKESKTFFFSSASPSAFLSALALFRATNLVALTVALQSAM